MPVRDDMQWSSAKTRSRMAPLDWWPPSPKPPSPMAPHQGPCSQPLAGHLVAVLHRARLTQLASQGRQAPTPVTGRGERKKHFPIDSLAASLVSTPDFYLCRQPHAMPVCYASRHSTSKSPTRCASTPHQQQPGKSYDFSKLAPTTPASTARCSLICKRSLSHPSPSP